MRWLDSITDSTAINLSKLWETVKDRGAWWAAVHWVTKSWITVKTFESPLDCKKIKPVNPKGNKP